MENNQLKIYCDGGARGNPGPAAAAFVAIKGGKVLHEESKFLGETTNNQAEYKAVILALLWLAKEKGLAEKEVVFILDSELVAKQVTGKYKIKNENLRNLFFAAKRLEKKIARKISYLYVPRVKNKLADFLVNRELDNHR